MRERRALGQRLHMVLGLNKVQIPGFGHDMVWGLGIDWRCGLVPDRYDGLDTDWGLDWGQVLDMNEGLDMNWGWDLVHGRSESQGLGWTWDCWRGTGTWNTSPFHC